MQEINVNDELERFRTGAAKYAAYLEAPEGRLRLDLSFANLQEFLPRTAPSLRVLDVGGGTGAMAIRLARLGAHVTVLDSSVPMLDLAERAAQEAGLAEKIALKHGDASELAEIFQPRSFDVVLCHNILEYVEDPGEVLRNAARLLREPSSLISILVRNQTGEVLKAAIKDGDLAAAEQNLSAECAHESLYGGMVRLFTAESLHNMLRESRLAATAERGVRVVSDYLPPTISRENEYDRIFELERKLGSQTGFAAIARYTHCIAHCTDR